MAGSMKNKLENAGQKVADKAKDAGQMVAEKAKDVGHKIAAQAEKAADWVKEKTGIGPASGEIREHMDVIGSCGNKLGVVDRVENGTIKLTRNDSPDGEHHYVPMDWVERVDQHVHLSKNCGEAKQRWNVPPVGAGI